MLTRAARLHLKKRDDVKANTDYWFLSNDLTGMSLYVDRFCGNLPQLQNKLIILKNWV